LLASRCFSSGATTMIDVGPTDLIAVANRSHNIFKLFSGSKKIVVLPFSKGELEGISFSIQLVALLIG